MSLDLAITDDDLDEPISLARRRIDEPELDITPMIDMTFLLLIFFLVTSVPDVQKALSLPPARHGVAVDTRAALIVTLAETGAAEPDVYLADGRVGAPLSHQPAEQETAIKQAVRDAIGQGKTSVLIKAERGVLHRYVARVSAAASSAGEVGINVAVMESR